MSPSPCRHRNDHEPPRGVGALFVEILAFITAAFGRVELIYDLIDAFQSLCDLGTFHHPQSTPTRGP